MVKPSKRLLCSFLRCMELMHVLENWSSDDGRAMEDYTLSELIDLAESRISEFNEPGHVLHDGRFCDDAEERKYCRAELRKAEAWLAKAQAERDRFEVR